MFKSIWSFIRQRGVGFAFWLARRFGYSQISYKPLATFLANLNDPMKDVAQALTDKDPNDAQQLRVILCEDGAKITEEAFVLIEAIAKDNIEDPKALKSVIDILDKVKPEIIEKIKCK